MGISASKPIKTKLSNSPEFDSVCDSAYTHCLSLTQHAFNGVLPYQLQTASDQIHTAISASPNKHPLILKWVPYPPTRIQVDSAFRVVARISIGKNEEEEEEVVLGWDQFKEWAAVLYSEAVVGNARKAVLARVPIGTAVIVGVGAMTRLGGKLVGAAVAFYAVGVAGSIYLGLCA